MATNETPATGKANVYGYCPHCGEPGVSRERRPNGNDTCATGHTYPSSQAVMENPDSPQGDAPATGPGGQTAKEITRYAPDFFDECMRKDGDGDYVAYDDHTATIRELRGALERISRSHDCGCRPCTGQCLSPTALQITVETMRDIANTALTASTARVGELEAFVFQVAHSQTNGDPALVATQMLATLTNHDTTGGASDA